MTTSDDNTILGAQLAGMASNGCAWVRIPTEYAAIPTFSIATTGIKWVPHSYGADHTELKRMAFPLKLGRIWRRQRMIPANVLSWAPSPAIIITNND